MINIGINNQKFRENWLIGALKKIPTNSKILDAGAGELQYKKFCGHLDYTSQDFCQYNGKGDDHGLQTKNWNDSKVDIVSDIITIPIEKESFDAIMCIEVLEHLPYPIEAIKEFRRILKNNGTLIITAPFCSMTHFSPYHFYSGYNQYWYKQILKENGFEIKEIVPNGNYYEYIAQELRRLPAIANRYSKTSSFFNKAATLYSKLILRYLQYCNKKNNGSEELLNFGFQIIAAKKN
jgi:ubiquinone/menaquinone biosynthesis C-methylase UbiE